MYCILLNLLFTTETVLKPIKQNTCDEKVEQALVWNWQNKGRKLAVCSYFLHLNIKSLLTVLSSLVLKSANLFGHRTKLNLNVVCKALFPFTQDYEILNWLRKGALKKCHLWVDSIFLNLKLKSSPYFLILLSKPLIFLKSLFSYILTSK